MTTGWHGHKAQGLEHAIMGQQATGRHGAMAPYMANSDKDRSGSMATNSESEASSARSHGRPQPPMETNRVCMHAC